MKDKLVFTLSFCILFLFVEGNKFIFHANASGNPEQTFYVVQTRVEKMTSMSVFVDSSDVGLGGNVTCEYCLLIGVPRESASVQELGEDTFGYSDMVVLKSLHFCSPFVLDERLSPSILQAVSLKLSFFFVPSKLESKKKRGRWIVKLVTKECETELKEKIFLVVELNNNNQCNDCGKKGTCDTVDFSCICDPLYSGSQCLESTAGLLSVGTSSLRITDTEYFIVKMPPSLNNSSNYINIILNVTSQFFQPNCSVRVGGRKGLNAQFSFPFSSTLPSSSLFSKNVTLSFDLLPDSNDAQVFSDQNYYISFSFSPSPFPIFLYFQVTMQEVFQLTSSQKTFSYDPKDTENYSQNKYAIFKPIVPSPNELQSLLISNLKGKCSTLSINTFQLSQQNYPRLFSNVDYDEAFCIRNLTFGSIFYLSFLDSKSLPSININHCYEDVTQEYAQFSVMSSSRMEIKMDSTLDGEIWEGCWFDFTINLGIEARKRIFQVTLKGNALELYASHDTKLPDVANTKYPSVLNGTALQLRVLNPQLGVWTVSIYAKKERNLRFGVLRSFSVSVTTCDAPQLEVANPIVIGIIIGSLALVLVAAIPIVYYINHRKDKKSTLQKEPIVLQGTNKK